MNLARQIAFVAELVKFTGTYRSAAEFAEVDAADIQDAMRGRRILDLEPLIRIGAARVRCATTPGVMCATKGCTVWVTGEFKHCDTCALMLAEKRRVREARARYRCSRCGEHGHNRRGCRKEAGRETE